MDKSKCEIAKVMVVKWKGSTYYIQRMPSLYNLGQDYAIMKDRKRLYFGRYETEKEAAKILLNYLTRELQQREIALD